MKDLIRDLDLRRMPPFERHTKIFEMWNGLEEGETLRIINDHEPKPLYYQFEAEQKGKFEWEYEQKGPKDWIFRIKRVREVGGEESKKNEVKTLLKQLHSGGDITKLKEKGKKLLKNISPTDLALIEQEMIREGTTRKEMRKLCDVHLEIMKEGIEKKELNLKRGHPIHTLVEEHKMILDFIDKLKKTLRSIDAANGFDEISEDITMLKHVAEHLVEADKHHQREEEVLFPALKKFGVTEPPEIMEEEHKELKPRKVELYKIAKEHNKMSYLDFVKKVREEAEFLIEELPSHIYKEDNILYPMAIQVLPENMWTEMKKNCDKIGYCCFTPES